MLPQFPGPSRVDLTDNTGAVVSRSLSGKRFARLFGGHLWQMRIKYPPMTRDEFAPLMGFIASQQGEFGTFTVVVPHLAIPFGSWVGAPVVSGAISAGTAAVPLSGFTPNALGVAKSGDLIKFTNHNKVYMVTASVSANAGGLATIVLNTPLVAPLANAEIVIHNNVPLTVSLDGPVQSYPVGKASMYRFDLNVIEAP